MFCCPRIESSRPSRYWSISGLMGVSVSINRTTGSDWNVVIYLLYWVPWGESFTMYVSQPVCMVIVVIPKRQTIKNATTIPATIIGW